MPDLRQLLRPAAERAPHSDAPGVVVREVDRKPLGHHHVLRRRAVFEDGSVTGATVLVHGVLGSVGSLAAQLARWGGPTVIGTVRRGEDLPHVPESSVAHAVALDRPDPVAEIRDLSPGGIDRIVEVAFSDNVDLDAAVAKVGTVIAAYATRRDRPDFPFWPWTPWLACRCRQGSSRHSRPHPNGASDKDDGRCSH